MLEIDLNHDETPIGTVIKIIGVGGAGGNAVNTMIENELGGVEFIVANTDIKDLKKSNAQQKLQLGKEATNGLGTGANPALGRKSAEESREEIKRVITGTNMLFIAAGMGGGTGTGAAPFIAQLAREMDILTIGICNRPFSWEGKKRMQNADQGILKFSDSVDTLMVVPNERIEEIYPDLTVVDAFKKADNILYDAAKAITDIIHSSGYINVDFADVKTVMKNRGLAVMGCGVADGEDRAKNAAEAAMNNPLLANVSLSNAKGVLINVTAGLDFKMNEIKQVSEAIVNVTGEDGDIFCGLINDETMEGKVSVTFIGTGLESPDSRTLEFESIHMNKDEEKAELDSTLNRIRNSDNMKLDKNEDRKVESTKSNMQMEVPAFLRRFSN